MAAEIALDIRMNVSTQHREMTLAVNRTHRDITLEIEKGGFVPEEYEGPYSVVPKLTEQVLATQGKLMTDDVEIAEITVWEVSNPQGGVTVTIGSV